MPFSLTSSVLLLPLFDNSFVVTQNNENSIFHNVDWYRVVLDEAHTIKSWKTLGAQAAFTLPAHCRWCLTGTPLQVCRENCMMFFWFICFTEKFVIEITVMVCVDCNN